MDFEPLGLATDLVILNVSNGRLQVLLIRRGTPPSRGRWALPRQQGPADWALLDIPFRAAGWRGSEGSG